MGPVILYFTKPKEHIRTKLNWIQHLVCKMFGIVPAKEYRYSVVAIQELPYFTKGDIIQDETGWVWKVQEKNGSLELETDWVSYRLNRKSGDVKVYFFASTSFKI